MKIRYLLADPRLIAKDNEGGGEGDSSPDPKPAQETAEPQPQAGRQFSQEDVDKIVVKRNKAVRAELEKAESRLESLIAGQNVSAQEKSELQVELESLQGQLRTKAEQAAYEAKKREAEYNKSLETKTSEADRYRTLFESQTKNNAIIAAASQHEAYNPEQFISLLTERTEVVEEENEHGEKTGRYVPRVKVMKKAEDGTVSEVYVTPGEAIEDMKNDVEKYGNLFRGNVAKGIGEGSNTKFAGSSRVDVTKMSDDEYFKNRKAIAEQYGIRERRRVL